MVKGGTTDGDEASDRVDIFNVTDWSWKVANLSTPRSVCQAVVVNNFVIFSGKKNL